MLHKLSRNIQWGLTVAIISVVASGCTSKPLAPEEQNIYDGKWVAEIGETYPRQSLNGWRLWCANMEGELAFEVVDGVVKAALSGDTLEQPLSAGGKFELKELSNYRAHSTGSSSTRIFDGDVTNILKGTLGGSNPKGRFNNRVQEAGAGCITNVKFVRVGNNDSVGSQASNNLNAQFENFSLRVNQYTGTLE